MDQEQKVTGKNKLGGGGGGEENTPSPSAYRVKPVFFELHILTYFIYLYTGKQYLTKDGSMMAVRFNLFKIPNNFWLVAAFKTY